MLGWNLLESRPCNMYYGARSAEDCIPATLEAQIYAAANPGRTGPMQRAPNDRVPFSPEAIQAARDAPANRGNPAASGSGAGPLSAQAPGNSRPGHTSAAQAPVHQPPTREYRRNYASSSVDLMAHLNNTPMKISLGSFVKEAPNCCADLIKQLQSYSSTNSTNARAPPAPRAPPAAPARAPVTTPVSNPFNRPFPTAPPVDNGPTPMETQFETEERYHADAQINNVNAVVRTTVDILGQRPECIVDTGASDTVLSHSVVCRLGLMDKLVPSHTNFLTAAGKIEKPMGMLPSLPVTIGSLTLQIDCMVTKANNYNVLIGNDWLSMAGADILLSSSMLRTRLGPDQYEDILIDADGNAI